METGWGDQGLKTGDDQEQAGEEEGATWDIWGENGGQNDGTGKTWGLLFFDSNDEVTAGEMGNDLHMLETVKTHASGCKDAIEEETKITRRFR